MASAPDLTLKIRSLPKQPGVYLFKNKKGEKNFDPGLITAGVEGKFYSFLLFGRYDRVLKDSDYDVEENFYMAGVAYALASKFTVSLEASNYSAANEYDKMVGSLGAQGTNAHTSNEETVYHNKIPANELEKWARLEKDRFSELVLRLFHTELEAVYEEFNRGLDSDGNKKYHAMNAALFPNHPLNSMFIILFFHFLKIWKYQNSVLS